MAMNIGLCTNWISGRNLDKNLAVSENKMSFIVPSFFNARLGVQAVLIGRSISIVRRQSKSRNKQRPVDFWQELWSKSLSFELCRGQPFGSVGEAPWYTLLST